MTTESLNARPQTVCRVQPQCGGCPLMPLTDEQQRATKLTSVEEGFARHQVVPVWKDPAIVYGSALAYRNRIRLRVDEQGALAFFNEDKTFDCPVLTPALTVAVEHLRRRIAQAPSAETTTIRHLEVRAPDHNGVPAAFFETDRLERIPTLTSALEADGWITHAGGAQPIPWQYFRPATLEVAVPINVFCQVHHEVSAMMVQSLVNDATLRGCRTFMDLFCGSGNIALHLGHSGLRGWGMERQSDAIAAANQTAERHRLNVEFVVADASVATSVAKQSCKDGVDLVVANPPRAGLKESLAAVVALRPEYVVVCCCAADSIAKDVAALLAAGYRLQSVQCFDMFPQTRHVEVMAWLQDVKEL